MQRRNFLYYGPRLTLGFLGLQFLNSSCQGSDTQAAEKLGIVRSDLHEGYGPLQPDAEGLLDLPESFSYRIISSMGDVMSDGFLVPGSADGMATFARSDGTISIIRNHEVSPGDNPKGAFGENQELLTKLDKELMYDFGRGELPCLGGTTTIVYDQAQQRVVEEYLSLAGTIRNCAGGPTPWNSWISCEENTNTANQKLEKNHGYNFEVFADQPGLALPIPIKAMGRFNHEAICVDPKTSIVYQTEDRGDGLIYRYLPNQKEKLLEGGKLQILCLKGRDGFDTRNWSELTTEKMEIGKKYQVVWKDIDGADSEQDDLRYRGHQRGGARFARGEGMWYGENELYFACTNGGHLQHGQIFKYTPSSKEGQAGEDDQPGHLEIFVEPNNIELIKSADNLTIGANGHLVICEDREQPRIVGISPKGEIYHIAKNVGFASEFAGATFSPDGNTLFVNIQGPGLTLAIDGPWNEKKILG